MTRKDYQDIADAIKLVEHTGGDKETLTDVKSVLCGVFAEDNQRFDRDKFLAACEVDAPIAGTIIS